MYDGVLNNNTAPDLGVIRTKPQPIRSDEWLVMTQMTVAQHENGFPVTNDFIGTGQDMAIVLDVPYAEWSVFFKPQNLVFFVAPLDFAFAFKWWLLGALLILGVYAFSLSVLRKKTVVAALLGVSVFLSPMVQWWYQSITIMPLAMGFFIAAIIVNLALQNNSHKKKLLLHLAFVYCSAVFAMSMYPPFQIPILLAVVGLYVSLFIYNWTKAKNRSEKLHALKQLGYMALAGSITVAIIGLFISQHRPAIEAITHTVYPGERTVLPGNYSAFHFTANHLGAFHQSSTSSSHYKELGVSGANQSEFSNFLIPIIPLIIISLLFIVKNWKREKEIALRNLIVGILAILGIFLLHLFLPAGTAAYKLIGLHLVPHNRLLIGVGFASAVLLVLLVAYLSRSRFKLPAKYTAMLLAFAVLFYPLLTVIVALRNPGFITSKPAAIALTGLMVGFLVLLLLRKLRMALILLLVLSVFSVAKINPLDHRLDELTSTQFSRFIQKEAGTNPDARWATNDLSLENYPLANGAKTLSGTYSYPQLSLWKGIDKNNENLPTYNRYAHVFFKFDDSQRKPAFSLTSMDSFQVVLSACDPFLDKYNVKYLYGRTPVDSICAQHEVTYHYGLSKIYIYTRK